MKFKLDEILNKKGITKYELSTMINVPNQTIYSWVSKVKMSSPTIENVEKICIALNIGIEELFEIEYKRKKRKRVEG